MTKAALVRQLLQAIPPKVRRALIIVFLALSAVAWVLQLFSVDLPWDKINIVLGVAGGYLGLQSAANINPED